MFRLFGNVAQRLPARPWNNGGGAHDRFAGVTFGDALASDYPGGRWGIRKIGEFFVLATPHGDVSDMKLVVPRHYNECHRLPKFHLWGGADITYLGC